MRPNHPVRFFNPVRSFAMQRLMTYQWSSSKSVFVVDKKRDSESTLRVYVRERLTCPLLNPRFQRRSIRGLVGHGILEITALSRGDETLDHRLNSFPSSALMLFKSARSREGDYFNHGYFAVPLVFRGVSRRRVLDIAALGPALTAILRHL